MAVKDNQRFRWITTLLAIERPEQIAAPWARNTAADVILATRDASAADSLSVFPVDSLVTAAMSKAALLGAAAACAPQT